MSNETEAPHVVFDGLPWPLCAFCGDRLYIRKAPNSHTRRCMTETPEGRMYRRAHGYWRQRRALAKGE